jgi:hypothetical protein
MEDELKDKFEYTWQLDKVGDGEICFDFIFENPDQISNSPST